MYCLHGYRAIFAKCYISASRRPVRDIAQRHSALILGFSKTIATIPGIVGVTVTGWLLDVTGTYSAAFVLTAGISVLSAVARGSRA
jgi:hypothetical protein